MLKWLNRQTDGMAASRNLDVELWLEMSLKDGGEITRVVQNPPADGWRMDGLRFICNTETSFGVLNYDDDVTVLRHGYAMTGEKNGPENVTEFKEPNLVTAGEECVLTELVISFPLALTAQEKSAGDAGKDAECGPLEKPDG